MYNCYECFLVIYFITNCRYLASGSLQRHMASIDRISKQHFGIILDEVCTAKCAKLNIKNASQDDFVEAANDFNSIWNFPNCLGAIDGKHVAICDLT